MRSPSRCCSNSGHFDGLNPKAPAWKMVFASIQSIVGTK
jgi:hypothetical protein